MGSPEGLRHTNHRMETQITELQRVVQQQIVDQQATTAALEERIIATEQAAILAAAAAMEVTRANATTMAAAMAAAGVGTASALRADTNKSTAKMPVFKKEEGDDLYYIYYIYLYLSRI